MVLQTKPYTRMDEVIPYVGYWKELKKEIKKSCVGFKKEQTWDDYKRAYATGQEQFRDKILKKMKEIEERGKNDKK